MSLDKKPHERETENFQESFCILFSFFTFVRIWDFYSFRRFRERQEERKNYVNLFSHLLFHLAITSNRGRNNNTHPKRCCERPSPLTKNQQNKKTSMEERRIRKYTNSELLSYIKNGQFFSPFIELRNQKNKVEEARKNVCGNLF